jgi:superfamily II DNA helicase RecQ
LLSILKDLRKKISKQAGQPPYNIFQDPSLEEMAIQYPVTLEELQNITGHWRRQGAALRQGGCGGDQKLCG